MAPSVTNSGVVRSDNGEILLAAGNSVELVNPQSPDLRVLITRPDNQAVNVGQLIAQNGNIGIYGGLIRQGGIVNANTAVMGPNGKIVFKATKDVTLDAGSSTTANGSQGGSITVQSDTGTTLVAGAVEAKGSVGTGGTVELLGNRVDLFDQANVNASGQSGGGTVLVGGDLHGANVNVQNAAATFVSSTASINADAIQTGNGGKVVVWADGGTSFFGNISVRGGSNSGNGGFAEVSGKNYLNYGGFTNLTAQNGTWGTLLLDPSDITIDNTANNDVTTAGQTFSPTGTAAQVSHLTWATIKGAFAGGNVIVTTVATPARTGENGDIFVAAASGDLNTANSLTLTAARNITFSAGANVTNSLAGDLIFNAQGTGAIALSTANLSTAGAIQLNSATTANGSGTISTGTGLTANVGSGTSTLSGAISGAGGLTKNGAGTLTLQVANNYSGGTTLTAGILRAEGAGSLNGTGTIALNGGDLRLASNANDNYGNAVIVGGDAQITSDRLTAGAGVTHTLGTLSIGANTLTVAAGANVSSGTAGLTTGATTLTGGATLAPGTNALLTLGAVSGAGQTLDVNGAGSITFSSTVGAGGRLGAITIAGANNVIGSGTITAATLVQTTGTGTTTFSSIDTVGPPNTVGGAVNIQTAGAIDVSGGSVATTGGAGATPGKGGAVTLNSTGSTVTLGTVTTNGGAGTGVTGAAGGDVAVSSSGNTILGAGTITTSGGTGTTQGAGGNVLFNNNVVIAQGATPTITTGPTAGDITFGGPVQGTTGGTAETLTLTAGTGNVNFNGAVSGSATPADATGLTGVTVQSANAVNFADTMDITGALVTGSVTPVTNTNFATAAVANKTFKAGSMLFDSANVTLGNGAIKGNLDTSTANGNITFISDNSVTFNTSTINAGAGAVQLTPHTVANTIEVCSSAGTTSCTGTFDTQYDLTNLTAITAGSFTIGRAIASGDTVNQTGAITMQTLDSSNTSPGFGITLRNAGTGTITVNGNYVATAGQLWLDNQGTGLADLKASITAPGGFKVSGNAQLSAASIAVDTSGAGGNITFSGTVDADAAASNRKLSVNAGAGTATFSGNIGVAEALADFDVTASSIVFNSTAAQTVNVTAQGGNTSTLAGPVTQSQSLTVNTNGATANNLTFTGAINGTAGASAETLTLDAGAGTLNMSGIFGAGGVANSSGLTDVTVTNAGATNFNGAIAITGALTQTNAATNATTFGDTVSVGSATLRGTTFDLQNSFASTGAASVTNSGLFTKGATGAITAAGGFSTSGNVSLANNITTTNTTLSIGGTLAIADAASVALSTQGAAGAGNITVTGATNGAAGTTGETLTLNAGTGTLTMSGIFGAAGVANSSGLTDVTLTRAGTTNFNGAIAITGALTQTNAATGATTFSNTVSVGSATLRGTAYSVNNSFASTGGGAVAVTNSGVFTKGATGAITAPGGFSTSGNVSLANNITTTNTTLSIGGTLAIADAASVALSTQGAAGAGNITVTGATNGAAGTTGETLALNAGTGTLTYERDIRRGGVANGSGLTDVTVTRAGRRTSTVQLRSREH